MRRREDRSQLATTRHAKRYDNRTVAATTRYPEGRTSRKMTGPENTRRQPKGEGEGKPGFFFPSDAFVASARSFNMFKSMLQLGLID